MKPCLCVEQRERQVLHLLIYGYSNSVMVKKLLVSETTVRTRRAASTASSTPRTVPRPLLWCVRWDSFIKPFVRAETSVVAAVAVSVTVLSPACAEDAAVR
ncbi:LuxR C-terminal-related transcriptional regulator [Noviherbaspirillum saxi]|uniref:LuxR C-terminal-related transcriptional regulator n=1 Tax=Noviherbaspirillum saxi TaxID=2320863 RepID=UPI003B75D30B